MNHLLCFPRRETGRREESKTSRLLIFLSWAKDWWYVLLPVMDDATHIFLLMAAYNGETSVLWWSCIGVLLIAAPERALATIYVLLLATTTVLSLVLVILSTVGAAFTLSCTVKLARCLRNVSRRGMKVLWKPAVLLSGGEPHAWPEALWVLLDASIWAILGARRHGSMLTSWKYPSRREADPDRKEGFVLRIIDGIVRWNPYAWIGRLLVQWISTSGAPHLPHNKETRRASMMAKAIGETLIMEIMFLFLGIATGDWLAGFTSSSVFTSIFSALALSIGLRHYIGEASQAFEESRRLFPADESGLDEVHAVLSRMSLGSRVKELEGPLRIRVVTSEASITDLVRALPSVSPIDAGAIFAYNGDFQGNTLDGEESSDSRV